MRLYESYVTSIEWLGIQRGIQQGILQNAREAVQIIKQLNPIEDREKLSQLLEVAVLSHSLAEFEQHYLGSR